MKGVVEDKIVKCPVCGHVEFDYLYDGGSYVCDHCHTKFHICRDEQLTISEEGPLNCRRCKPIRESNRHTRESNRQTSDESSVTIVKQEERISPIREYMLKTQTRNHYS